MENEPRFVLVVDEELELRLMSQAEAEELFALIERNRPYLREWLPWVDFETDLEDSQRFIARASQRFQDNEAISLGMRLRGELIGVISLHTVDWPDRKVEIGYWQGVGFQGQGLMTRACKVMISYAFRTLQLNRVAILCATDNRRSRAIPERLGFSQEGTLRDSEWLNDHFVDLVVYSMLAREWENRYPG